MPSVQDDRGYNQGFVDSDALEIRTGRRVHAMIEKLSENDGIMGLRLLEIGCGTGDVSYRLARGTGAIVYGTDLCLPFIEQAKASYHLPNLKYGVLDFNDEEQLDGVEETGKFDAVVGNGILHHLYYGLDKSLPNICRLLKPGGRMVFWEPNFFNPYCLLIFNVSILRKLARLEPTEMTFTRRFIRRKLEEAGFCEIEIEFKDFLLPSVPNLMIRPLVSIGALLEKIPVLKAMAQSIFISAMKRE